MHRLALIGNPNSGKSTLFNALTGSTQTIGNWSGVTVERKSGTYRYEESDYECVDLPGVYSLVTHQEDMALDERIASDFLANEPIDLLINIVDATQLERHLYLTLQCRELNIPMLIVLNMMDVANKTQLEINIARLQEAFACPVIAISAKQKDGLAELYQAIARTCQETHFTEWGSPLPKSLHALQENVKAILPEEFQQSGRINRLLAGDSRLLAALPVAAREQYYQLCANHKMNLPDDLDILIADSRYVTIHTIVQKAVKQHPQASAFVTGRLDQIVLNRWLSLPIFFGVMYCLFFIAIHVGGILQDAFNILSSAVFVDLPAEILTNYHAPSWLVALLAHGIGKGINTTLTFIPVLTAMFFCTAYLEQCGYMARAAFAMDRIMRAIGLPGKAFVPLIIGFGCNVPAIMASRTLANPRDRILTCLMAPFMSCGARLAIYAVFTSAFFPQNGHVVVFALYLLGILVAIATGFIVRKTLLPGPATPLVMDLPRYQWPSLREVWQPTRLRTQRFIHRAGIVILPLCAVLGILLSLNMHGELVTDQAINTSILAVCASWLTPLFHPLGIVDGNWPAVVGLLTGSMAKEVVIATLNTLYSHLTVNAAIAANAIAPFNFYASCMDAFASIGDKIVSLPGALFNPISAAAPDQTVSQAVYGVMANQFAGKAAAFSYLVFVLLYVPCFSTIAATARELNRGWAMFSLFWSLLLAYSLAVMCYQLANFSAHPMLSLTWVLGLLTLIALVITALWGWRYWGSLRQQEASVVC